LTWVLSPRTPLESLPLAGAGLVFLGLAIVATPPLARACASLSRWMLR